MEVLIQDMAALTPTVSSVPLPKAHGVSEDLGRGWVGGSWNTQIEMMCVRGAILSLRNACRRSLDIRFGTRHRNSPPECMKAVSFYLKIAKIFNLQQR